MSSDPGQEDTDHDGAGDICDLCPLDSDPEQIDNILSRRDGFPGDWVEVNIDSYHDHRTAFSFTTSVSGTRGDEFISNDGNNWDGNWDPIWEFNTRVYEEGGTA